MTDVDLLDLARDMVTLPGWRWRQGMRPRHTQGLAYRHGYYVQDAEAAAELQGNPWWAPDLADPATLGCLLALVREAWRAPLGQVSPVITILGSASAPRWVWYHNADAAEPRPAGPTEAHALVAALRGAP